MVARNDCFVVLQYKYRILKNIFQMLLEIFALLLKVLLCRKEEMKSKFEQHSKLVLQN